MKGILFGTALALASLTAATPAVAAEVAMSLEDAATSIAPNDYVWQDTGEGGPVSITVSLADQRAYIYRGGTLVAVSAISSGRDGKETPLGRFPILQKQVEHKSNLYNSASMPFMQRLTWDGVSLHAGDNPGYPNSHGCIHLPTGFAKKLFAITRVGTVVQVVDTPVYGAGDDLVPADVISSAKAETMRANRTQYAANMR